MRGGFLGKETLLPVEFSFVLGDERIHLRPFTFRLADGGPRDLHPGLGRFDFFDERLDSTGGLIECRARLVEARLVGAGIDFKQQVARADELIVPNRQGDDGPGDPRRDLNHVRLHLPVAGPGVGEMGPTREQDDHDGDENDRAREEVFLDGFHERGAALVRKE